MVQHRGTILFPPRRGRGDAVAFSLAGAQDAAQPWPLGVAVLGLIEGRGSSTEEPWPKGWRQPRSGVREALLSPPRTRLWSGQWHHRTGCRTGHFARLRRRLRAGRRIGSDLGARSASGPPAPHHRSRHLIGFRPSSWMPSRWRCHLADGCSPAHTGAVLQLLSFRTARAFTPLVVSSECAWEPPHADRALIRARGEAEPGGCAFMPTGRKPRRRSAAAWS